ncbi:MAG: CAP domain-containing protein [Candidatus Acidiferrum sp.]
MPKPATSAFSVAQTLAVVAVVMAAALTVFSCVGGARTSDSLPAAQSSGDPNRPPSAQNTPPRYHHTPISATERPSSGAPSGPEKLLFDQLNESRVLGGLQALRWDADLAAAARKHCAVMVQHEELSHQFAGEPALQQRLQQAGVGFSAAAENVAVAPTAEEIHYEWMHSPPHRANILDPQLTAVGIAAMAGNKGVYAVQDFALAVEKMSLIEQEERIRLLIAATGVRTADDPNHTQSNDARKTCLLPSGYAGKPASVVRFETADLSRLPDRLQKSLAGGKYRAAAVGACSPAEDGSGFTHFRLAVLLY